MPHLVFRRGARHYVPPLPQHLFFLNFVKGYLSISAANDLFIALGVFFSTFLSGPIALLSTSGVMVGGIFHWFLFRAGTWA